MKQYSYSNHVIKVALFAVTLGFLGLFGSDIYLPAMPAMKIAFNSSISGIEFSIAIYLISFALSPLIFGPLADCYGRKTVVTSGLSIALIGAIIAGLSHSIDIFLVARLIQGFGAGATLCIFRVMLRDVVQGKKMAVLASYTTMVFNLSPVLGMVIGGYLVYFLNWRACFLLIILSYVLFIVIYLFFCPETLKAGCAIKAKVIGTNYMRLLSNTHFIACAICSGLAFSTIFSFATTASFIFQHGFHVSAVHFGWLGLALSLSCITGKVINARLVSKLELNDIITLGIVLISIAGLSLLLPASHTLAVTLLLVCIASGSTAFILSNVMAIAMRSYSKGAGAAASVYSCIQLLCGFVTNGLLAHFARFGILSLSVFYMAIAFTLSMQLIIIRESKYA